MPRHRRKHPTTQRFLSRASPLVAYLSNRWGSSLKRPQHTHPHASGPTLLCKRQTQLISKGIDVQRLPSPGDLEAHDVSSAGPSASAFNLHTFQDIQPTARHSSGNLLRDFNGDLEAASRSGREVCLRDHISPIVSREPGADCRATEEGMAVEGEPGTSGRVQKPHVADTSCVQVMNTKLHRGFGGVGGYAGDHLDERATGR